MHRLKKLRKEAGMSQADLAALLGVQPAAVSKYETGRSELSEGTIRSLCLLFQVSADYLLGIEYTQFHPETDPAGVREEPDFGSDLDFFERFDKAAVLTDGTILELERQFREVKELGRESLRFVDALIYRLHYCGVSNEVITRATGFTEKRISALLSEDKPGFK